MTRAAAIALALAGCNWVYGLESTTQVGGAVCDPLPYDPNRYTSLTNGNGFTWNDARTACAFVGFDLLVIDDHDSIELANELQAGTTPFWLGVSYATSDWVAIDSCPPTLIWEAGQPGTPQPGDCVIQTAIGMRVRNCTDFNYQTYPFNARCEAKRPSPQCQVYATQRNYAVISSTITAPVTHDAAAQKCANMNMHLVEIDSTAELDDLLAGMAVNVPKFWLGAQRGGAGWTSPTGCPQIFVWGPNLPNANACSLYQGGMSDAPCNDGNTATAAAICELNTM